MTRLLRPARLIRSVTAWALFLAVGGIAGCESLSGGIYSVVGHGDVTTPTESLTASGSQARVSAAPPLDLPVADVREQAAFIELGSGEFVRPVTPAETEPPTQGSITLNFENTALSEVVKVILGDLLEENYVIDPGVQGTVTLQTSQPLARRDLVPTLEMLLRMNESALVRNLGIYQVVPRELAVRGLLTPQLGDTATPLPEGYTVRVVPLRFVSATEMERILEPFAPMGSLIRIDTARNLLVLAGSGDELAGLIETVAIFDVDWLNGLSVGLFTPDFVDAATLAQDLASIFGDQAEGPLAGLVKIVTIERLDALLVVSPRPEYLTRVGEWIERLDRDSGAVGQRLFVYHVQNGKATDLADVLSQVFEPASEQAPPPAELAPGLEPVDIQSETLADAGDEDLLAAPPLAPPAAEAAGPTAGEGLTISRGAAIRIIADEVNNALLIMATGQQYRQVAAALQQLDIVPLQVLIEATIAEVTLTGDLSLGLEWFFKNRLRDGRVGEVQLDLGAVGLDPAIGFSYAIRSAADVRVVLNALASDSKLNIISSPSLMVLNNQKASIQVGDQVPITTQQQQATAASPTLVNNIEFRDTGVLLTVTPRVNAGGLVIMELEQEVSDVAPGSTGSLTPTIQQRKISSTVAIQSGETVVLGGLIRENKNRTQSGLPGLYNIPVLGLLFGNTSDSARRTELVILITPRAVQDANAARSITDEFRRKMESLKPFYAPPGLGLSPELGPDQVEPVQSRQLMAPAFVGRLERTLDPAARARAADGRRQATATWLVAPDTAVPRLRLVSRIEPAHRDDAGAAGPTVIDPSTGTVPAPASEGDPGWWRVLWNRLAAVSAAPDEATRAQRTM